MRDSGGCVIRQKEGQLGEGVERETRLARANLISKSKRLAHGAHVTPGAARTRARSAAAARWEGEGGWRRLQYKQVDVARAAEGGGERARERACVLREE